MVGSEGTFSPNHDFIFFRRFGFNFFRFNLIFLRFLEVCPDSFAQLIVALFVRLIVFFACGRKFASVFQHQACVLLIAPIHILAAEVVCDVPIEFF